MLEELVKAFAKELELKEPMSRGDSDGYHFLLDDTTLSINEAGAGFQLVATVGEIPKEQVELFFSKMLRGNLFAQATSGAALGLDETGVKMILRYYHPIKANYREFKEHIEDFINTIDFWKQEVKSHQANPLAA